MLVLKLKKADRVTIGNLRFEIKEVSAGRVRMAMQAPADVEIRNEAGDELDDACECCCDGSVILSTLE